MSADPERSETEIPENLIAIQHTRQVRKLTGVRRRAAASRCADAIAVALQRYAEALAKEEKEEAVA